MHGLVSHLPLMEGNLTVYRVRGSTSSSRMAHLICISHTIVLQRHRAIYAHGLTHKAQHAQLSALCLAVCLK